jgi:hypothetical protein
MSRALKGCSGVDDVFGETDIGHASLFQGNRVLAEMFEHFGDRREPQMLNATLALDWERKGKI